jgi:hypothetical protein
MPYDDEKVNYPSNLHDMSRKSLLAFSKAHPPGAYVYYMCYLVKGQAASDWLIIPVFCL